VHVGIADHGDAEAVRGWRLGIVGLARVPALGVDADAGFAAVGVAEGGARVGLIAHDAVARDVCQHVIGFEKDAEDHELGKQQ
jgi:hypothetical protein